MGHTHVMVGLRDLVCVVLELQDMDGNVSSPCGANSGGDKACNTGSHSHGAAEYEWNLSLIPRISLIDGKAFFYQ
jgi:hypothetical protein